MKTLSPLLVGLALLGVLLATAASAGAQPQQRQESQEGFEEILPGEAPLILLTDEEVEELVENELEAWVLIRESWGLMVDRREMIALAGTREGQLGRDAYSIPLTYEERTELDERGEATRNSSVGRAVVEEFDGYAEMFMDHQGGGMLTINFNRDLTRGEEVEIRAAFEVPDRVAFRQVEFSLAELEAVVADLELQRSRGELAAVSSVVVSPMDNAVIVGVSEEGLTTSANPVVSDRLLQQVEREILAGYEAAVPEMIELQPVPFVESAEACWGRLNCGTAAADNWRGGTGLDTNRSGAFSSSNCTTGFVFVDGGLRYLSTAGHCDKWSNRDVAIAGQDHGEFSPPGASSIDRFALNSFITNWPVDGDSDLEGTTTADAALIRITSARSDNRIYKSYQKRNWVINDEIKVPDFVANQIACVSGNVSQWRCGTIVTAVSPPEELKFNDVNGNERVVILNASFTYRFIMPGILTSLSGNSGAPIIAGRAALGTHVSGTFFDLPNGNTQVDGRASPINLIEAEFPGVSICLSAADC